LTYWPFKACQNLSKLVTGLFCATAATFAAVQGGTVTKRLYQWLSQRASSFQSGATANTTNRTVRTEVTVERQSSAVLMGGAAVGFDTCPLCGTKLGPDQAEQARLRLPKGPISA
jgi:hypothetical protein